MEEKTTDNQEIRRTSRALPIALLRARETVMTPIREMLNEIGITEQKWRILRTLHELGRLEQSAIADHACLLLPSVTRITQSMEANGLVTRIPDTKDKRKMMVEITRAGNDIITSNTPASNAIYQKLENDMGIEKVEQLLDLLEELQSTDGKP